MPCSPSAPPSPALQRSVEPTAWVCALCGAEMCARPAAAAALYTSAHLVRISLSGLSPASHRGGRECCVGGWWVLRAQPLRGWLVHACHACRGGPTHTCVGPACVRSKTWDPRPIRVRLGASHGPCAKRRCCERRPLQLPASALPRRRICVMFLRVRPSRRSARMRTGQLHHGGIGRGSCARTQPLRGLVRCGRASLWSPGPVAVSGMHHTCWRHRCL